MSCEKTRSDWFKIAESNGIDCCTFDSRIYKYKWTHEKAATTSPMARHKGPLTNCTRSRFYEMDSMYISTRKAARLLAPFLEHL